jgi:hypothetical protein
MSRALESTTKAESTSNCMLCDSRIESYGQTHYKKQELENYIH